MSERIEDIQIRHLKASIAMYQSSINDKNWSAKQRKERKAKMDEAVKELARLQNEQMRLI